VQDESKSSLLLFDIVSTTIKDIVGKKVSKLRSIAELRAFYGIVLLLCYFMLLADANPNPHGPHSVYTALMFLYVKIR
jgi:hypothetical protein